VQLFGLHLLSNGQFASEQHFLLIRWFRFSPFFVFLSLLDFV
jgi:hypothetical protein